MSNFEKMCQYLKDNNIELSTVLVLVKILLEDLKKDKLL